LALLEDVIAITGLIIAMLTAFLGLRQYSDSLKLSRGKWLYKFYREFYLEPRLNKIREKIDSKSGIQEVEELLAKDELNRSGEENQLFSEFTDFLNFFEFMLYLTKNNSIKEADVEDMFNYYLTLLGSSVPIKSYLPEDGYELLSTYLRKKFH